MRAGKLRHPIEIQYDNGSQNSFGQQIPDWTKLVDWHASIEPLQGNELWRAQQVNAEVSHRVRMRYRASITPRNRIVFDSRNFDILAVLNHDEKNRELELLCKEVV